MRKLRMGIIDTGMALKRLHLPAYRELADKFELATPCDHDAGKAAEWAGKLGIPAGSVYPDPHELIKRADLDAFDIMVPIEKNFEVTEEVAEAGKPISCEKPLVPTLAQASAFLELPRR